MEAPEAPPIEWTTDRILTMLGITRNSTQESMSTEPEEIGHINDEDAEGTQSVCGRYKRKTSQMEEY